MRPQNRGHFNPSPGIDGGLGQRERLIRVPFEVPTGTSRTVRRSAAHTAFGKMPSGVPLGPLRSQCNLVPNRAVRCRPPESGSRRFRGLRKISGLVLRCSSRAHWAPSQYSHRIAGPFGSAGCSTTLKRVLFLFSGGFLGKPRYYGGVTSATRSKGRKEAPGQIASYVWSSYAKSLYVRTCSGGSGHMRKRIPKSKIGKHRRRRHHVSEAVRSGARSRSGSKAGPCAAWRRRRSAAARESICPHRHSPSPAEYRRVP